MLVLLFCFAFSFFVQGQTLLIDSLKKVVTTSTIVSRRVKALHELSDSYAYSYPDSALAWAKDALALSEKIKDDTLIFWSYVCIGRSLYPLGNFSAELDNAYKLQPVAKRLNTLLSRGYSLGSLSDAYLNFGEYETSLYYWRKVVAMAEQEARGELTALYGNASYIFARAGQYDSALIYGRKSFAALFSAENSYKDSNSIKFFTSNITEAIGEAFAGMKQYDSALHYHYISLSNAEKVDMRFNIIDACNSIAEIYGKQLYNDSAIFYCNKVLALDGVTKRFPISVLKTATLLAGLYENRNQPDSSLKYMHLASDIKDSVYSREKTSAFQSIIFQQKDKENEVAVATEKLKSQYQMYCLIVLFIVLAMVAGFIIRNRRIKQLQTIRNSIADDLHDDIGSTLSSISIMNELAKKNHRKLCHY